VPGASPALWQFMIRQDEYERRYQEGRKSFSDDDTEWLKMYIELCTRQTRECYAAGTIHLSWV